MFPICRRLVTCQLWSSAATTSKNFNHDLIIILKLQTNDRTPVACDVTKSACFETVESFSNAIGSGRSI